MSTGPLQGLPISVKDLFAAGGYPCFAGSSRRLPADPWERDRPLVATLRRQLSVIVGKTHMVEFAFGGTGQNSHHGTPYNPWDATAHRSAVWQWQSSVVPSASFLSALISHDHPGEGQMGIGQIPRRYSQSRGGAGMGPFRPGQDSERRDPGSGSLHPASRSTS